MDPKLRMEYRVDMDGRVYRFRDTPSPDGSQDGPEHSGLHEMQHSRSMNLTPPHGDQNLSQLANHEPKPPGREADPILPEKQADSRTQASSSHVGSRKRRNSSTSSESSSEVRRSALVRDYIPPAFDDYQSPQGLYNAIDFHNAMSKSLESYAKHMGIKRPSNMDPPIQPDAPIQPDPPIQFPAQPNGPFPFPPYPQFANLAPNLLPAPSPEHFIAALLTRQIYRTLHERELRNQMIQQNVNILLNAGGNPHPVQQQHATPGLTQVFGDYVPQHKAGAGGPIRVHQENPFHNEIPRATDPYGARPTARDRRQLTAEEEFARCSEAYSAVDQRLHHFCQQNGVLPENKNQEEIFLFADYHRAAFEFYESFAKKKGFVRPDNQGAGPS